MDGAVDRWGPKGTESRDDVLSVALCLVLCCDVLAVLVECGRVQNEKQVCNLGENASITRGDILYQPRTHLVSPSLSLLTFVLAAGRVLLLHPARAMFPAGAARVSCAVRLWGGRRGQKSLRRGAVKAQHGERSKAVVFGGVSGGLEENTATRDHELEFRIVARQTNRGVSIEHRCLGFRSFGKKCAR